MLPDAPQFKHDVFISYARRDAEIGAVPLDSALKQQGFRVWRDIRDIDPSQDFTAAIEKAIEGSRSVIVCITPDVRREDSFVRREIAYAIYLKKPLLVVRFADLPPPIHVFTYSWVDFFTGWDAALAKVVAWLRGTEIDSSAPASVPPVTAAVDPYREYVEALLANVVKSLKSSVISRDPITLHMMESPGDVPPVILKQFISYALNTDARSSQDLSPIGTPFNSLHDAYFSISCEGRVLLLGEPGAGKTTSLLAFARDAAVARLSDPSQPLPVFARISSWKADKPTRLADWLAAVNSGITANALAQLIERGRTLLLLDGLDELNSARPAEPEKPSSEPFDRRDRFLKLLPLTGRVILSSRVEDYRRIGMQANLNCAVRLEPLDNGQMEMFLGDVPNLWKIVADDHDLKDALRTPLLLALFRKGYQNAPEAARALHKLSAGELNDRIFDVFIKGRWAFEQARSPEPLPYDVEALKAVLGRAAAEALVGAEYRDSTRISLADIGADAERVIRLALRLDLLQVAEGQKYRFLHLRLRDALAFPILLEYTHDKRIEYRRRALSVLEGLDDRRAVAAIIDALWDTDQEIRLHAVKVLGKWGEERAFEPLLLMLKDPSWYVRFRVTKFLRHMADQRVFQPLIGLLKDSDELVRAAATVVLGELGIEMAIEPLIAALNDRNEMVRYYAADALRSLGTPSAIQPLITALNDIDFLVRHCAATALKAFPENQTAQSALKDFEDGKIIPHTDPSYLTPPPEY